MSVDRIDLDGDYTVENMRLMHVELNGLKSNNHNDFFIETRAACIDVAS